MKILIAADMEGITGVVHWNHVDSGHSEYERFRKLMAADVNAAVQGAFEAGADEVLVTDGHDNGRNILIEELDPRAHLHSGHPSPLSFVEGIQNGVDGVLLVGYHARIGAFASTLDHTWSGVVANLALNGEPTGEIGLNAAICGHFDIPVLMISGEQSACGEAIALLGKLETAVVKKATSRFAAELLPPLQTGGMICEAAANGVLRLRQGTAVKPWKVATPVTITVEFFKSEMALQAAILPGAQRSGNEVSYQAADMLEAFRAFLVMTGMAGQEM
jgi:D-amino peptidase